MRPGRLKQEVASEDGQPGARRLEANHGVTPSGAGARGKRLELSAELLSILLVGVALAALILTGIGGIREDMREIREDMRERFSAMESRMSSMESRLAVVEREQGEIRGLLEGMHDAAAGRGTSVAPITRQAATDAPHP